MSLLSKVANIASDVVGAALTSVNPIAALAVKAATSALAGNKSGANSAANPGGVLAEFAKAFAKV